MKKNTFILFLIFFFYISVALFSYRAMTCYGGESNNVTILDLDSEGNISIYDNIITNEQTDKIVMASDSKSAFPYCGKISIFKIDKNQNVNYLGGSPVMYACYNATISYDNKYLIAIDSVETLIKLLRIENDLSLTYTGSYVDLEPSAGPLDLAFSKFNNTILGNCYSNKEIDIFRMNEYNQIIDTGERVSIAPYRGNSSIVVTPEGRYCYISGNNPSGTVYCEISTTGEVSYKGVVNSIHTQDIRITSDSRFLLQIEKWEGNIYSFRIESDGSLTLISLITRLPLAQAMDITPDNKYVIVSWNYTGSSQTVSVLRLYSDGALEKLNKDVILPGMYSDISFIPPYVTSVDDIWEMYK